MIYKKFLLALAVLLLMPTLSFAYDWVGDSERLHYKIEWGFLDAGEAEILLDTNADKQHFSFVARAWSNPSYSALLKLRDRISMAGLYGENQSFLPLSSTTVLKENDYRAHKLQTFNHAQNKVTYQNVHAGYDAVDFNMGEHNRNLISALYHLRSTVTSPKVGDVYTVPVFGNDRAYVMNLHVVGKKRMKTKALGKVNTLELKPVLEGVKSAVKKDKMTLWVTDDGKYTPVKIKIKLKFGSFEASLLKTGSKASKSKAPADFPIEGEFRLVKEKLNYANPVLD